MHAAIAVPESASTILTHVFGRGLADESYVVERYKTLADSDIRRMPGDETPAKGRRKAKRTIASLDDVRIRPCDGGLGAVAPLRPFAAQGAEQLTSVTMSMHPIAETTPEESSIAPDHDRTHPGRHAVCVDRAGQSGPHAPSVPPCKSLLAKSRK